MLFSLLSGGDLQTAVISILLSLPIILFALVLHETAHGYIAWKCGDNTAYNMGRLTLNPTKHLDPIGFLCMLVFGFGWAKPVPINTRNFRNPKRGMALSAAAGPAANFLLGIIGSVFYGIFLAWYSIAFFKGDSGFLLNVAYWLTVLCRLGALYNFLFAVFNLIPIPPFDGSRIAFIFLPSKIYFGIMRYERQIMLGLLIVLFILSQLGFSPFSWVAEKLTEWIATPFFNIFYNIFCRA